MLLSVAMVNWDATDDTRGLFGLEYLALYVCLSGQLVTFVMFLFYMTVSNLLIFVSKQIMIPFISLDNHESLFHFLSF